MDTETNPIENESELVEPSEPINENGCDDNGDNEKPNVIDETVTHQPPDDKETDQSIESEIDQKHDDNSESSPLKSPASEPIVLCVSETEPCDVIDTENTSENDSPEKISSETTPAVELDVVEAKQIELKEAQPEAEVEVETPPTVEEREEEEELPATEVAQCNDSIPSVGVDDLDDTANTIQLESSPEKSSSELACLIPSPSDPMNDSVNENSDSWDQLKEPIDGANYDDSDDDVDDAVDDDSEDGGDNEFSERSNPKTVEQKTNNECQIFELTDDNSSVDDVRESDGEDDIDADEMGEEEEEEEDDEDEPPSGIISDLLTR